MGSPLKFYILVVFCNQKRIRLSRRARDLGQLGRYSTSTPAAADKLWMPKTLKYLKDGGNPNSTRCQKDKFLVTSGVLAFILTHKMTSPPQNIWKLALEWSFEAQRSFWWVYGLSKMTQPDI